MTWTISMSQVWSFDLNLVFVHARALSAVALEEFPVYVFWGSEGYEGRCTCTLKTRPRTLLNLKILFVKHKYEICEVEMLMMLLFWQNLLDKLHFIKYYMPFSLLEYEKRSLYTLVTPVIRCLTRFSCDWLARNPTNTYTCTYCLSMWWRKWLWILISE